MAFKSRDSPDCSWSTVQGFTSRHQFLQLWVCLCSPVCYVRHVKPIYQPGNCSSLTLSVLPVLWAFRWQVCPENGCVDPVFICSKMPLAITWDAPAFSSIFGTPLKLEKGKEEKELQSYNAPFCKYPSHADVSVPGNPLCKLLIIKRISTSLSSGFLGIQDFQLVKKEKAFHSCSGTAPRTGGFVQRSYG